METLALVGICAGLSESREQYIERLNEELARVNVLWVEALERGEDDNEPLTDAYFLKHNAKRLCRLLESLEA